MVTYLQILGFAGSDFRCGFGVLLDLCQFRVLGVFCVWLFGVLLFRCFLGGGLRALAIWVC